MVRTQRFHCGGPASSPGWGTKIPQAVWPCQKKKKKKNLPKKIIYDYFYCSIVDIQYFTSFRCTTQWFNIYMHCELIITISLVTICHHTKLRHNYWLYSLCCTLHLCDLFYKWECVPLNLLHLFFQSPHPPSLWLPPVCSLYLWVCFCFVFF